MTLSPSPPTLKLKAPIRSFRILLTNTFGLLSKLGDFHHAVHVHQPDIAIVTESKLTPEKATDSELSLPGYYSPLRKDRTAHGGGVAVWVKASLALRELDDIQVGNEELIWLSVRTVDKKSVAVLHIALAPATTMTSVPLKPSALALTRPVNLVNMWYWLEILTYTTWIGSAAPRQLMQVCTLKTCVLFTAWSSTCMSPPGALTHST